MSDTTLQIFPSDFPIKVMGRHDSNLRALTQAIIERHAGPLEESNVRTRTSGDGNFLALTYVVRAVSREPGTLRRYSRTSRNSLPASNTNNVIRPVMLISRIHGSHLSNAAEFCAADASSSKAASHRPIAEKTRAVEPCLRTRSLAFWPSSAVSTYTTHFRDASR